MKKLALCIGNDDYIYPCLGRLESAVNDAKAFAEKLKHLDFEVIIKENLTRQEMHENIDAFEETLQAYDVGLFYYAGHGFEINGDNLLMPVDTNTSENKYREWTALKLETVINALEGKKIANELKFKIIILDACRQKPYGRGEISVGFASVFAPKGTLIAFSTSPGQISLEKNGHGLYTKALLNYIDTPRIQIENMFKNVREMLSAETQEQQISWEHTSLMGTFFFNEARIESGTSYIDDAFKDENYKFDNNNSIGKIVNDLKSYNWYLQQPAIKKIYNLNFENSNINDLFVLGRNIYQSANGGEWGARWFIDQLDVTKINENAKIHLLNGMAYEIFFNKKGKLRENYKTDYYINVIKLLENELFLESRNFINEQLNPIKGHIIYSPGSYMKLNFHLNCKIDEKDERKCVIKQIGFEGRTFFEKDDFVNTYILSYRELREIIARKIVAPPDMINFTYSINVDNCTGFEFDLKK